MRRRFIPGPKTNFTHLHLLDTVALSSKRAASSLMVQFLPADACATMEGLLHGIDGSNGGWTMGSCMLAVTVMQVWDEGGAPGGAPGRLMGRIVPPAPSH